MKHLTKNFFVFTIIMIASAITINAQHQMNHSKMDSTKKMMQHKMKDSSNHMDHKMMTDSSKMHHKNVKHNQMKMDDAKQTMNMENKIWNSHCPIREGEVDLDTPTVQYKGKTIGFCCPGCDSKFMENPEKYMKKFDENGNLKKKSE